MIVIDECIVESGPERGDAGDERGDGDAWDGVPGACGVTNFG